MKKKLIIGLMVLLLATTCVFAKKAPLSVTGGLGATYSYISTSGSDFNFPLILGVGYTNGDLSKFPFHTETTIEYDLKNIGDKAIELPAVTLAAGVAHMSNLNNQFNLFSTAMGFVSAEYWRCPQQNNEKYARLSVGIETENKVIYTINDSFHVSAGVDICFHFLYVNKVTGSSIALGRNWFAFEISPLVTGIYRF